MKTIYFLICAAITTYGMNAQAPNIDWESALGGSGGDQGYCAEKTADGGYVLGGSTTSTNGDVTGNNGQTDVWAAKIDASGNFLWGHNYGGSNTEFVFDMAKASDGGFYIVGKSNSNDGDIPENNGSNDMMILKINSDGSVLEGITIRGGSGDDQARAITTTINGDVVVGGLYNSTDGDPIPSQGGYDFWVLRLTENLTGIWQKRFGGSGDDLLYSMKKTSDGGFILGGQTNSPDGDVTGNQGGYDYWAVKISGTGTLQWQKTFGGTNSDRGQDIVQTPDGGYIMAGHTLSNDGDVTGNHGENDIWIVKMDANGNLQWQKCFGGSQSESAYSIISTTNGYVVAGNTESNDGDVTGNHGGNDYWMVRFSQTGNLQWQKTMGGNEPAETANEVLKTDDDGYLLVGESNSSDGDVSGAHGQWDFWAVKLDPDPLSVNEFDANPISIYPNPAKGYFTVDLGQSTNTNGEVSVSNLLGKTVFKSKMNGPQMQVTTNGWVNGMYFVNIRSKNGSEFLSEKILIH